MHDPGCTVLFIYPVSCIFYLLHALRFRISLLLILSVSSVVKLEKRPHSKVEFTAILIVLRLRIEVNPQLESQRAER